jgi:hypothetical protein
MTSAAKVQLNAIIVSLSNVSEPVTSADPIVGESGNESSRLGMVTFAWGVPDEDKWRGGWFVRQRQGARKIVCERGKLNQLYRA